MKVAELIGLLKSMPKDASVSLKANNHTYNSDTMNCTHGEMEVLLEPDNRVLICHGETWSREQRRHEEEEKKRPWWMI